MIRRTETLDSDWEAWWQKWDKHVPGWFNVLEAKYLFDVVYSLPWPASIIEIGAYRGRSTIVMLKAIQLAGTEQVHNFSDRKVVSSIDNFSGTGEQHGEPTKEEQDTQAKSLLANIGMFGLAKNFGGIFVNTSSAWFESVPIGVSFDMFFIDGCHLTAGKDVEQAWARLKSGGVLICHDYDPNAPSKVSADIDATGVPGAHCGVGGTSLWVARKS